MEKYKIVVNAGHCPNCDSGAAYHGLKECDITCSVGHAIVDELNARGYDALFIQDDDLNKVCEEANKFQANLFISLHCNAFSSESANGTEVFVYKETSNAMQCATNICNNICKGIGTHNRGVKTANFQVLRDTAMPACLVEMFFLSNNEDVHKAQEGLPLLIKAICDGAETHFA